MSTRLSDVNTPADSIPELTSQERAKIIAHVQRWLDQFVIDLDLCPFARKERVGNRIRFAVTAANQNDLLQSLGNELEHLNQHKEVETTLLIHPHALTDFDEYNQFLNAADALLDALDLVGVFQVASFHPDYQFAGTLPSDADNFTNRSPYPMLHILRESSVQHAVDQHPDVEGIPARNIAVLKRLGGPAIGDLLRRIEKPPA